MAIRFFDMFAGIGGFRSGLKSVGGFECVGHCEIDKYANQAYNAMYSTKGECFFEDARTIDPGQMPDIDLICGGFPCQSFSIAGKRRGFADDARGTLFFEIARLAASKRPAFLLLENVPGLLSHDRGRTFATILSTLDDMGYDVAWQVLNSKNFGVPQSRKRVYIVGYLRDRCTGEVLSFTDANGAALEQVLPGPEGNETMSIKHITTDDLRRMRNSEGLILQGCGGDLQEWVDGINGMLTGEGILRNGGRFTECSTFEHNGLTCLLFPFQDVNVDMGRLAIWRLKTHDTFGGTWLSDYVPNRLGGFDTSQPEEPVEIEEDENLDSGMSMK